MSADQVSVSGGLFLHAGFHAEGVIRLVSANVGLLVDDRTCWPLCGSLRLDGEVGWVLFEAGARAGLMVPTKAELYTSYEQNGQVPPFYPPFGPLLYSLDTLLPTINFRQKDHWWPRDGASAIPIPPQWALVAFEPAASAIPNPPTARGEAHGV
jgi:hypothetical protein